MKSILITGGSGYLGHGLVERLIADGCKRICIYSRGEARQHDMRLRFDNDPRLRWLIGDVRDEARLERALQGVDGVIHCAALKRIEVAAYCPEEVVKTNVLGSLAVLAAAERAGVQRAVLVSSDKAYEPVSAYGYSKALAECLFQRHSGKLITSVCRYGNVAGSTGSVIPLWRPMAPGHVRVTDPDCTRFWMYRTQAVELVLNTLRYAKHGEMRIPDLPAFRLGDLAEAMCVSYDVIGLPEHEKRHESMDAERCSETAPRMSVRELREALRFVT